MAKRTVIGDPKWSIEDFDLGNSYPWPRPDIEVCLQIRNLQVRHIEVSPGNFSLAKYFAVQEVFERFEEHTTPLLKENLQSGAFVQVKGGKKKVQLPTGKPVTMLEAFQEYREELREIIQSVNAEHDTSLTLRDAYWFLALFKINDARNALTVGIPDKEMSEFLGNRTAARYALALAAALDASNALSCAERLKSQEQMRIMLERDRGLDVDDTVRRCKFHVELGAVIIEYEGKQRVIPDNIRGGCEGFTLLAQLLERPGESALLYMLRDEEGTMPTGKSNKSTRSEISADARAEEWLQDELATAKRNVKSLKAENSDGRYDERIAAEKKRMTGLQGLLETTKRGQQNTETIKLGRAIHGLISTALNRIREYLPDCADHIKVSLKDVSRVYVKYVPKNPMDWDVSLTASFSHRNAVLLLCFRDEIRKSRFRQEEDEESDSFQAAVDKRTREVSARNAAVRKAGPHNP